jgi:cell fate (sporulation/competence/biofilm development) regulator YlbF (YheA/YmcA/DUF963 family)
MIYSKEAHLSVKKQIICFYDMIAINRIELGLINLSIMEARALDMSTLITQAYEIGDLINSSTEVAEYLYWKQEVEQSQEVQKTVKKLERKKELYEECQRFGHFHPDYHAAMEEVKKVEEELEQFTCVKQYKLAEEQLDDLLYSVSSTIANSVSDSIKVPSNKLLPSSGGCSTGGSCSGKCS